MIHLNRFDSFNIAHVVLPEVEDGGRQKEQILDQHKRAVEDKMTLVTAQLQKYMGVSGLEKTEKGIVYGQPYVVVVASTPTFQLNGQAHSQEERLPNTIEGINIGYVVR